MHSNYKTEPCKNWNETGECKFGEGCSFYHSEAEKRNLIDPLPNLPEGVTLPPMPEKLKNYQQKKASGYYKDSQDNQNFLPVQQPPMPMLPIQSLTEMVALGGFNPNKYMTPTPPQQFSPFVQNQSFIPFPQVHGSAQPMPFYGQPGQPQPFYGQNGAQAQKSNLKPKEFKTTPKSDKMKKKASGSEKKYVSKQQAEAKTESTVEAK